MVSLPPQLAKNILRLLFPKEESVSSRKENLFLHKEEYGEAIILLLKLAILISSISSISIQIYNYAHSIFHDIREIAYNYDCVNTRIKVFQFNSS